LLPLPSKLLPASFLFLLQVIAIAIAMVPSWHQNFSFATQRNAIRFPLLLLQEPKAKQSAHSGCLGSERLYPYCCLHVVVATYIDRSN
jgi:hypothetical protein